MNSGLHWTPDQVADALDRMRPGGVRPPIVGTANADDIPVLTDAIAGPGFTKPPRKKKRKATHGNAAECPKRKPGPTYSSRASSAAKPPLESDVLAAVLAYLQLSPKVAFAWRANTGAVKVVDRWVKFGFCGQPDILGMLKDGRFLAIEVKRPGGGMSQDQHAFLARVNKHGGLGFVARSVDDLVLREFGK